MDYRRLYEQKRTSAAEAVRAVRSGDWVDYGWCLNNPVALDAALAARKDELRDVKVRGGVTARMPRICEAEDAAEHFTWHSWHCTGIDRKIMAKGMGYFLPLLYRELPKYYRDGSVQTDVAMIQVTPMDENGNFNYGLSASQMDAMLSGAKTVIVEVNKNLPWVYGRPGTEIHIGQVDLIVEGDDPPVSLLGPAGEPTETDKTVARMIVDEIPDGACLQLGIGGMPNAVGSLIAQSDLKDLSVHTELYVDAFVEIAEAGKITGKHKEADGGRQVFAFALGNEKLYRYLDRNPDVCAAPVDYTNDIRVVAGIDRFISINNAINMDLFGQVNAESVGTRHISGTGGQLDFVMGAYLSKGGKSFICMSSVMTDREGRMHSRILPTLAPGSMVSDPRPAVQYIVTEYGMINLKGASTWERAERIISIAHPDFREELIREAEKMKIWRKSNRR